MIQTRLNRYIQMNHRTYVLSAIVLFAIATFADAQLGGVGSDDNHGEVISLTMIQPVIIDR